MTDRDIEMSGIDEDGDNVGLSSGEKLKKHDSVLKYAPSSSRHCAAA